MTEKLYPVHLTGSQITLLGKALEQTKTAIDVLSMDVQAQINAQIEAERAEANKKAEEKKDAPAEPKPASAPNPRRSRKRTS